MKCKLVRDRCNAVKEGQCEAAQTESHYVMGLILKLHEEAQEIAKDPSEPEEYADLLEVLWALADANCVSSADIMFIMETKRKEFGGFSEGQIWTEVEL